MSSNLTCLPGFPLTSFNSQRLLFLLVSGWVWDTSTNVGTTCINARFLTYLALAGLTLPEFALTILLARTPAAGLQLLVASPGRRETQCCGCNTR